MRLRGFLIVALSIVALWSITIMGVYAGSASSLGSQWVGKDYGDHSGQVDLNTTVYVYWTGITPSDGTVDITIIKPDSEVLEQWLNLPPSASGTIDFVANMSGTYLIRFDGHPSYYVYTTLIAASSVFVLPESALGTLTALFSGVLAVAVFSLMKPKVQSHFKKIKN
jgi:hypothetical protein